MKNEINRIVDAQLKKDRIRELELSLHRKAGKAISTHKETINKTGRTPEVTLSSKKGVVTAWLELTPGRHFTLKAGLKGDKKPNPTPVTLIDRSPVDITSYSESAHPNKSRKELKRYKRIMKKLGEPVVRIG